MKDENKTENECERKCDDMTCFERYNCCSCGGKESCGCRYCFDCNACDSCQKELL